MKRFLSVLICLLLVCGAAPAPAETGIWVDEESGDIWNYDTGIITNADGEEIGRIEGADGGTPSSGGAPAEAETGADGGMTVTSTDGIPVPQNADGSITVESGQVFVDEPESEGSGKHLSPEEWAARWAKYSAANGVTGTVYMDEVGEVHSVQILHAGLGRSTVLLDGREELVPTSSLRWESEAPEDRLLAVVTPARQSYLTLRAKKSQKSFVMGHCDKCKVLLVINTGKTWTLVDDEGVRGYVLTSGLTFYDNAPKQYAAGLVTVKGKTPSGNTVHARYSNTNNARQTQEFPVGTPVTVFSQDEKWCEIDIGGWHCYMLSQFVTLQEPLVIAEAVAEAVADPALAE